ncbi:maleylpyruvate isomerase N-terminal domain-containing protein [Streptomyces sp. NPDC014685]|uniref:maleylpyruvate isomerase N-terminal domain-containing protein n=1 Tax=Streptomyces sp. NPDC014685 TaxID=3364881 RepID=UPI0036FCA8A9
MPSSPSPAVIGATAPASIRWRMAENRLDDPVPACPEWRIRDVVHHLGNVASFVHACVEQGAGEPGFTDAKMLPDDRLIAWAAKEWDGGSGPPRRSRPPGRRVELVHPAAHRLLLAAMSHPRSVRPRLGRR